MNKQYVEREEQRTEEIIASKRDSFGVICASDLPLWKAPKNGDCFGPWRFQQKNLTLQLEGNYKRFHREIDLEQLGSSAELLNTLHHNLGKNWGNPEVIGNLIVALYHLSGEWWGDPKLNLTEAIQRRYAKVRK